MASDYMVRMHGTELWWRAWCCVPALLCVSVDGVVCQRCCVSALMVLCASVAVCQR